MAFPNYYSTSFAINAASTAGTTFSFGFLARYVRVDNLSAVAVSVNPQNAAASSGGFFISTCAGHRVFEVKGVPIAGVGLTSTTTAAGGAQVNVFAVE